MSFPVEHKPNWFRRWRNSSLFVPGLILLLFAGIFAASFGRELFRRYTLGACVTSLGGTIQVASPQMKWSLEKYSPPLGQSSKRYLIIKLSGVTLTSQDIQALASRMRSLKANYKLDLSEAVLDQADLSPFSDSVPILSLDLAAAKLSDRQLQELSRFSQLLQLDLNQFSFSPESFRRVTQIKSLTSLNLDGTNLTDEFLPLLKKMKHLRFVSLSNTALSEAALKQLATAIPKLEIADD